jgi:DNA (cytosine-5)-methyltransferase 1
MKQLRIATVFSGIGAFEQALIKEKIPFNIVFACDNGERTIDQTFEEIKWFSEANKLSSQELNDYVKELYERTGKENWVKKSYFANYKIDENHWYEDIRFIDGKQYCGKVDILVGGSPCQSFSNIGKRGGLEDARGTLFYDYARLVSEIKPKVFIYENVPGMLMHDKGNTWKTIKSIFMSLGYDLHISILNSEDYGVPQSRRRLYVIGFKKERPFVFPTKEKLIAQASDSFEKNIKPKYYLGEKGFKFVTSIKYRNRARVNQPIIRTEKANQQFNWNGDFVFVPFNKIPKNKEIKDRAYIGMFNGEKGACREMTPRECLRLMGFPDTFKIVVPDVHMYRQSGNSIVVNVLQKILKQILAVEDFNIHINLATVFSGIGSIEFALKRLQIPHNLVFACDNGERDIEYNLNEEQQRISKLKSVKEKKEYVDKLYSDHTSAKNYVEQSYLANYPELNKDYYFQDVKLLDGKDFKGKVDLFVGGSPCQSFSSVGFQKGLEDARGTLFYDYARLIKEIQPKVFIYENVRNLLSHDKGNTWEIIHNIFNHLGYTCYYSVLNAADYGIPQTRRRLFVVGFKEKVSFSFPPETTTLKYKMKDFTINNCPYKNFTYNSNGDLVVKKGTGKVDPKYILSPKLYRYVMSGGTKSFYQKPIINKDVARTLLKTMGNRHRAGIDNYVSFDGSQKLGSVRMLTEREALRLMGFTDDYNIVVSRAQTYKQAGNSIVVDVMIAIINSIIASGALD